MMSAQWDVGYITRKRAQLTPDRTAIIFEDQSITYKEINDGVNRCARFLQKKGIKNGDRVAVLLFNCMEFIETFFAVAKLGAIFVPLNCRLLGQELEYQLNDCDVRLLVFHDSFLTSVDQIRNRIKVEEDKFIYLKSGNPDMPDCPEWAQDYLMLVKDSSDSEPAPERPIQFDDPLAILYTSGTTGNPKGAVLSHQQTYFKNYQVSFYTDSKPDDVLIAQMPLFHSAGLFIVVTPAICNGMIMVMRRGFDPEEFAEDIQRYRATIVLALTTMWRMILETGKLDRIDVSSVRTVMGGGETTPPSLIEALSKRGLYLQLGFGQTENSAMMTLPKEDIFRKMGSIGKPGFFTDIWIQDDTGKRLPPGEVGEIVAKGPTVMSGYWNMPETTEKTIINGVLHTGDLGYMDDEGYFYMVDRAKDMYRSGGENVYPAEVEKILSGHPKVSAVAIIGVPDEKWGEVGMAFILPASSHTTTEEELRAYLKGKAAGYKHPVHIKFMDELPMTGTMKIKKAELREKYGKF